MRKRIYKDKFVVARHTFDREYRKAKRQYNCGKMLDIDTICVNDPNKFWDCLKKKLGPHRKSIIPLEIYDNNIISCNITQVLERWKKDFESLYNLNSEGSDKAVMKNDGQMGGPVFTKEKGTDPELNIQLGTTDLNYLNVDITIGEVQRVVLKTKRNKASAIDKIPYDVLKNERLKKVLTNR